MFAHFVTLAKRQIDDCTIIRKQLELDNVLSNLITQIYTTKIHISKSSTLTVSKEEEE